MEDECFPAISMNAGSVQIQHDPLTIKDEPSSETESNHSSSPPSPHSTYIHTNDIPIDVEMVSPSALIKSSANILITSPHAIIPQKIHVTKSGAIKLEPRSALLHHSLPPTPPSCSSSEDSEDNAPISQPGSPAQRKTTSTTAARLLVHHHTTTRQPINTPLISSQPVSRKLPTTILCISSLLFVVNNFLKLSIFYIQDFFRVYFCFEVIKCQTVPFSHIELKKHSPNI